MIDIEKVKEELQEIVNEYGMDYYADKHFPLTNKAITELERLQKYATHLAKQYGNYVNWSLHGKNGADSENEKGYWRGMADSVLAFLNDLKKAGIIKHTGLHGDDSDG